MRSIVELSRTELGETRLGVHTFRNGRCKVHFHRRVTPNKANLIRRKMMDLARQDRVKFRPYQGWYVGWEAWID